MSTTYQRFSDLCWATARLWQVGDRELPRCADDLHDWALREGLIASHGEDAVQAIMAAAFAEVSDDL